MKFLRNYNFCSLEIVDLEKFELIKFYGSFPNSMRSWTWDIVPVVLDIRLDIQKTSIPRFCQEINTLNIPTRLAKLYQK